MVEILVFLLAALPFADGDLPRRPVHTYSIVARDPATGDLGVAVQSHWFAVGTSVAWAEAGVGAVATQSFTDPSYGALGLQLMRSGKTAKEALAALIAIDPNEAVRQVAMVDRHGNVAAHTGKKCIAEAGHQLGQAFSAQANLMEKASVWPAMAKAYEKTQGDLADRLVAALEAAEAEGGDLRGQQSAALLIVPGELGAAPWTRKINLRVDDNPRPLVELKRLLHVQRTYQHMNRGDDLMTQNDVKGALAEYATAAGMYPEMVEIRYWQAITMATAGKLDEALPIFREVFKAEPRWRVLTPRLVDAGLLPNDKTLLGRIMDAGI
jgi:uncharacterized Ntn-hydrolase superfamily protein